MPMIDTIVFDFGDVFINLDKEGAMTNAIQTFGLSSLESDMIAVNNSYEKGLISTDDFLDFYSTKFPEISKPQIIDNWNFILKDFPEYRLDFIMKLSKEGMYNLILLSNTNALNINYIVEHIPFYDLFKDQFDGFYLSHEIQRSKPDPEIFNYIVEENKLVPEMCLFIDDTIEHINTAHQLGFKTWHIDPEKEDVVHLFDVCKDLF